MSHHYRGYARGASCADVPAHQAPIVAVPTDWTLIFGSRAQRRRLARQLKREAKNQSRQDGGKK